jgi:carbamate kinase
MKLLSTVTVSEARQYQSEGHFPAGSMGPKMEAAIDFVEKTGGKAVITSLDKVVEALRGETGTTIVPDAQSKSA